MVMELADPPPHSSADRDEAIVIWKSVFLFGGGLLVATKKKKKKRGTTVFRFVRCRGNESKENENEMGQSRRSGVVS